MNSHNNIGLLPTNGELRATVFFSNGFDSNIQQRHGWWRVQGGAVVGRKFRGRNTFPVCSVSNVVDVVAFVGACAHEYDSYCPRCGIDSLNEIGGK